MTKKILAMFLAVMMVISLLPTSALAVELDHANCCPGSEVAHTIDNCKDYQILGLVEATCTEAGGTQARCNHCGKTFMLHETAAAGTGEHSWGEEVAAVEPTCQADGMKAYKVCKSCEAVGYDKAGEWTVVAKQGEPEEHETLTADQIAALKIVHTTQDHKWVNKTPEITCENHEEGAKQKWECSVCKETKEVAIAQNAHTWNNGEVIKGEDGKATGVRLTCSHCLVTKDVAPVDDHDHVWVNVEKHEATCTTPGTKAYEYCAKCGAKRIGENTVESDEELIIPVKGHTFDTTGWTCKTESAICTVCHLKYEGKVIEDYRNANVAQNGHKVDTTKFTCKEDQTLKCENCEKQVTPEDVDFTRPAHTRSAHEKPCVDNNIYCTKCEKLIEEQAAVSHTWVIKGTNTETNPCTDINAECSVCKVTAKSLGLGNGHTYGAWGEDPDHKATCTEKGDKIRKCTVCGETQSDKDAIDELGHDKKSFTIPGNCVTKAYTVYYCVREGCALEKKTNDATYDWSDVLIPGNTYKLGVNDFYAVVNAWCEISMETEYTDEGSPEYSVYATAWILEECEGGYCLSIELEVDGKSQKFYLEAVQERGWRFAATEEYSLITFEDGVMLIDGNAFALRNRGNIVPVKKENWENSDLLNLVAAEGVRVVEVVEGTVDAEKHENIIVSEEDSKAANCYTNSVTVKKCDDCGTKFAPVTGNDKLNHMKDGKEYWIDAVDGELAAINEKLGTEYTAISKKPTCVEDGYKLVKCGHEGCTGHYKYVVVTLEDYLAENKNYDPHAWDVAAPTASHEDQIVYWTANCTRLGCDAVHEATAIVWADADKTYASKTAADVVHRLKDDTVNVDVKATCTTKGSGSYTCTVCNKTVKYEIAALDHDWATVVTATGELTVNTKLTADNYHKDPTCQSTGYTYSWGCKREGCSEGHKIKDVAWGNFKTLEKVDHKMKAWDYYEFPTTYADCDKPCYLHVLEYCEYEDCVWADQANYTDEQLTWIKEIHFGLRRDDGSFPHIVFDTKLIAKKTDADLCKDYNYEVYACPCGQFHVRNLIGNFGHQWVVDEDNEANVGATCTTYGKHVEYCALCNPDALNDATHKDAYKIVTDAKLTYHINSDGIKFTEKCNDETAKRDCVICEQENVGKLHTLTEVKHEATCETKLYYSYECADCDYVKNGDEIGKALGHTYSAEDLAKKPVANYDGDQTWEYTCTREGCGKKITEPVHQLKGMHLVVDGKEFTYGSLIAVTVRLDNVKADLAAYQFAFNFNKDQVAYVGYENLNEEFVIGGIDAKAANVAGAMNVSGVYGKAGDASIDGNVELVKLYFRVKSNNKADVEFSYAAVSGNPLFTNKDQAAVNITVTDKTTTVKKRILGDFDGIAGLTIHDVRQALGMITYENTDKTYDVAMDVNFDGKFTAADVQILMELLSIKDTTKRAEAVDALVREAMGEEHAALCFELHHCSDENCGNTYYENFEHCPVCGKVTAR